MIYLWKPKTSAIKMTLECWPFRVNIEIVWTNRHCLGRSRFTHSLSVVGAGRAGLATALAWRVPESL
jgi:hypothetical protein